MFTIDSYVIAEDEVHIRQTNELPIIHIHIIWSLIVLATIYHNYVRWVAYADVFYPSVCRFPSRTQLQKVGAFGLHILKKSLTLQSTTIALKRTLIFFDHAVFKENIQTCLTKIKRD